MFSSSSYVKEQLLFYQFESWGTYCELFPCFWAFSLVAVIILFPEMNVKVFFLASFYLYNLNICVSSSVLKKTLRYKLEIALQNSTVIYRKMNS